MNYFRSGSRDKSEDHSLNGDLSDQSHWKGNDNLHQNQENYIDYSDPLLDLTKTSSVETLPVVKLLARQKQIKQSTSVVPAPPQSQKKSRTRKRRKKTDDGSSALAAIVAEQKERQFCSDIDQDHHTVDGSFVPKPPPGVKPGNYSRHTVRGRQEVDPVIENALLPRRRQVQFLDTKSQEEIDRDKPRPRGLTQREEEELAWCRQKLRARFNQDLEDDSDIRDTAHKIDFYTQQKILKEEEVREHRRQSDARLEKERERVRSEYDAALLAKQKRNKIFLETREANNQKCLEFRHKKLEQERLDAFQRARAKRLFEKDQAMREHHLAGERMRQVEDQIDCEREQLFARDFEEAKEKNDQLRSQLSAEYEKLAAEEEKNRQIDLKLEGERRKVLKQEGKPYIKNEKEELDLSQFDNKQDRLLDVSNILKPKKPSPIKADHRLLNRKQNIAEIDRRNLVEQTTYYEENLKSGRNLPKVGARASSMNVPFQSNIRDGQKVGFKIQQEGGQLKTQKITGNAKVAPSYNMRKACGFKSQISAPVESEEITHTGKKSVSWIPDFDTSKKPKCQPRFVPYEKVRSQGQWADTKEKQEWLKNDFYPQVKDAFKDRPRIVNEANIQDAKDWYKEYRVRIRRGDFS